MDFLDLAQKYATARMDQVSNRFDQATQPFTDPEGYMEDRFGNVKPKSTTIVNNNDGSQTVTTKHEITPTETPAATPAPSVTPMTTPTVTTAPMPTTTPAPAGAVGPVNPMQMTPAVHQGPTQINGQQLAPNGTWNDFQDQSQLPPEARMPQPAPAAAPAPATAVAPAPAPAPATAPAPVAPVNPNQAQMVPTSAQQTQPAPNVAPPAAVQQAPGPQWQVDLEKIHNNPTALANYVGNENNPAEARALAAELWQRQLVSRQKEKEAQKTITGAMSGDPKDQKDFIKQVRSAEGSYVKAYLFARLGLNDLAREEQQKLGAGTSFGRSLLNGRSYATETNGQGAITQAWDESGRPVDDSTLNSLNANAVKQGSHQYGFTGGSVTIPRGQVDAGQEYRQRTNSITGQVENVITTGPNAGKIYSGPPGLEKSVQTAGAKKELTEAITAKWAGPIAANRSSGTYVGKFNQENGANIGIRNYGGGNVGYVDNNNNGAPIVIEGGKANFVPNSRAQAPAAAPAPAPAPAPAAAPVTGPSGAQSPASTAKTQPQPKFQEPGFEGETPAGYQARVKAWGDANKKVVGQESAKQYAAQNVYPIVRDINTALSNATGSGIGAKVDDIAAWFGHSTEGAKAIAQLEVLGDTLLKSVPRFEGPQSDRDVASYHAAAGKLADPNVPVATKAAAFKTIVELNKKYSPELDWSFGKEKSSGIKIIKREKVSD